MNTAVKSKELLDTLKSKNPSNPILQRLKKVVAEEGKTGLVITSYDRMHHRHNRS